MLSTYRHILGSLFRRWYGFGRVLVGGLSVVGMGWSTVAAQQVELATDEECGCEIRYVDGIETTQEGDLFGFRRKDGTVIVPNRYRYVDQFHGNYCIVFADEMHRGLIDREGREVLPCIYSHVEYPSEGRILVRKGELFGFADLQGHEVIEPQYVNASNFSEGLACIALMLDDSISFSCTFIDTLGQQVMPAVYDNISPFSDGFALAYRYGGWGLIDHRGRTRLPHSYGHITPPSNGYFFAADYSDRYALFDTTMHRLTDYDIDDFLPFSDGLIVFRRGDLWGAMRRDGTVVIEPEYDEMTSFGLGRARVRKADRYGIIDTTGRLVLPIAYEGRMPHGEKYVYHDSLALVEQGGKKFFVDLEGRPVGELHFDDAFHFSQGRACVRIGEKWGYIDRRCRVVIPVQFDIASPFSWGRAEVYYQGRMYAIDLEGNCVKNCKERTPWLKINP